MKNVVDSKVKGRVLYRYVREEPMRILRIIVPIIVLILAIGCGACLTEPEEESYVMSLEVGNLWEYSVNGYEVDSGDTTILAGTLTRAIISEVTHAEGFQVYGIEETTVLAGSDTSISFTNCYYLKNTFDELRVYDDTTSAEYFILFKHDPVVGQTWTPGNDPHQQIEVMGLYNVIEVPAGKFYYCACTKETNSLIPAFMRRFYWGEHSEGVICSVEQDSDFYFIYELTSSSIL